MTTTQPAILNVPIDVTNAKFKADPFPFYARLRAEAPVYPINLPRRGRAWLITRYDDVQSVLKDDRFVKDHKNAMTPAQLKKAPKMPPMFKSLSRNLLAIDPPDHDRLRALVHKAFTPRMIDQVHDQIQAYTDQLLDKAAQKGHFDLITDFALPIPLTAIGTILGVPPKDTDKFYRGTKALVSVGGANANMLTLMPRILGFMRYVNNLVKERTARPTDDLITALAQAKEGDDRLTQDEVVALICILLSAGHETTVNLIGSGSLALLQNPAQFARLSTDPAIGRSAVEEILRYVCPAEMATERFAREDVTIAGTTIPRGEVVMAVLGSANRDAAYFDQPDTFDLGRENNKHLAFGQGIHYCIGAPLARMEGQIALTTLAKRMPNLRLGVAAEALTWHGGLILRGLESLPVTL